MKAVNLMPRDHRAARAAGSDGPSSTGVYLLLGGLAALAVFAALWTVTGKQINDRQATLTRVEAQASAAEKRAAESAPYEAFAKLARDRVATVTSLAATRFDFANSLREVSRVLPADVWLTALNGSSGAVDTAPTPTTSAAPAPKFELDGCTLTQSKVARLMARLRAVNGVRKVELRQSTKPDSDSAQGCPAASDKNPAFTIAISFSVPGAPKDEVDSSGQVAEAPAPVAATPPATSAGSAAPASTTPATAPVAPTTKAG